MYHFLMFIHVVACLAMVLVVLLQTGRGAGLQMFGGGGDSLITTPGGSSFMKKFTTGLAATFAFTSLFLTLLQNRTGMSSVTSKISDTPAPIKAGANAAPGDAPAFDAMIEAAKGDRADVVAVLAANGFNCGAKDSLGVPAISYATAKVSTATVAALLACKADVNARDAHGFTPLIRAVQGGQAGTISYLLAHGARVDDRDNQGYTALMWAAHDGAAGAAKLLLAAGADPAVKGKDGRNAYAIATARSRTDVAALLPPAP